MLNLRDTLQQVHDLTLPVADAEALIQAAIDAAYDRSNFARAAMTGLLATGVRHPSSDVFAAKCFEVADCMVAAAKSIAPDVAAVASEFRL